MEIQGIVSRFREDVSWVGEVPFPVIIYNKGDTPTGLEETHEVQVRPNVGREGETFLNHIVEHYDALPEYLVMLQGKPFDHAHNILAILNDPPHLDVVVPLGTNWKYESLTSDFNWPGFKEALLHMADMLEIPHDATVRYMTGAEYVVPRARIHARPRAFYESLRALLNTEINPLSGWVLERLWPYVLGSTATSPHMQVLRLGESGAETLRELALHSTDFVVVIPKETNVEETDIIAALTAYPILKAGFRMEDDLVLGLVPTEWGIEGGVSMQGPACQYVQVATVGAYLTHRSVLLQHLPLLESTDDHSAVWRDRHIPLLAPVRTELKQI